MATGESESLGTARVDLTVDTSEYTIAIDRAKAKQGELAQAAQDSGQRMTAAERKRVDALERAIAKLGLTRQEVLALRAAELLHGDALDKALVKIKQNSDAIQRNGAAAANATRQVNAYGLSQKQVTAAMRQVPAQMTDIFVSLAGGQNPMMVMIQQGGQLKDVFGGIKPAAAALGSQLLGLINPLTLVAGGAALTVAAFINAAREQDAFVQALAITNNSAGMTITQLENMAARLSSIGGETTGNAAEAIAKVVSTGRFAADEIEKVAIAAEQMRINTGADIEDTIATFVRLKDDPVKAILQLNESQHFLTEETYAQIRSLVAQGNQLDAGKVALDAYADRVNNVTNTIRENIGYLQQFARWVKQIWADIADSVMSIGRATTNADLIKQQQAIIAGVENARGKGGGGVYGGLDDAASDRIIAKAKARINDLTKFDGVRGSVSVRGESPVVDSQAVIKVEKDKADWQAVIAGGLTKEMKLRQDLQKIEETGVRTNQTRAEIDAAKDRARKAAETKSGGKKKGAGAARSLANAESRADLQEFKDILAEEQNVIRNNQQITQAQYAAKLIDIDEYYKRNKEYIQQDTAAQEKALTGQIAALKARNVAGKDSVDNQRQLHQLESQLARVRADGAAKMEVATIQEKKSIEDRIQANKDYKKSLDEVADSMRKAWDVEIMRAGMGEQEFAQVQRIAAIYDKQREALEKLNEEKRKGEITQADWQQRVRDTMLATDAQVRAQQDGYTRMLAAQQDWLAGMRGGLNSWMEGARDISGQVRNMMTNSLDRVTDALTEFALTGKMKWREMLADILSQISKFFMKQAVLKFAELIAGYFMGQNANATASGVSSTGSGVGSSIAGGVSSFNAKGGVYASQSLSAYSGQVVSSTTPFYFAKGGAPNVGVMGEAGHEAILPLSKGADGVLGVKMYGGGGGNVAISVVTNVSSDGSQSSTTTTGQEAAAYKEFSAQMGRMADERIQNALRPNGTLWKAGVRV